MTMNFTLPNPRNTFKHAIAAGQQQIGLWCSLGNAYTVEIAASARYDWLLIDTEHSPTDVLDAMAQLQVAAAYPVHCIVRPAHNDAVLIKRYLDCGAQTLLIPMVNTAAEAQAAVAAITYPPKGIRGVAGLTRAGRFGRIANYTVTAQDELCLLVQVETVEALSNLEAIANTNGVDGVFIGPADLSASMGYPGQLGHPAVKAAIADAIARIRACGKAAGILTADTAYAKDCIALGTTFTAVGLDVGILARGVETLRAQFPSHE
jgi:4-hydroxy-2-oxoheptanedioate aldolase